MGASAVGLVVKYLVAIEMPRVRFPDGAYLMSTPPRGAAVYARESFFNRRVSSSFNYHYLKGMLVHKSDVTKAIIIATEM